MASGGSSLGTSELSRIGAASARRLMMSIPDLIARKMSRQIRALSWCRQVRLYLSENEM